jgi:hypothetical protein
MIMGGGKTSVIAPVLALLLADGKRLVAQMVPDALLDHSMHEIQDKFRQIVRKDVLKFYFVRKSADESHADVLAKYAAHYRLLANARTARSVVCTAPACMKSLMLEYVDLLQRAEAAGHRLPVLSVPPPAAGGACAWGAEPSATRHRLKNMASAARARLREGTLELEAQADALSKILNVFQSRGVVLIDEVPEHRPPLDPAAVRH